MIPRCSAARTALSRSFVCTTHSVQPACSACAVDAIICQPRDVSVRSFDAELEVAAEGSRIYSAYTVLYVCGRRGEPSGSRICVRREPSVYARCPRTHGTDVDRFHARDEGIWIWRFFVFSAPATCVYRAPHLHDGPDGYLQSQELPQSSQSSSRGAKAKGDCRQEMNFSGAPPHTQEPTHAHAHTIKYSASVTRRGNPLVGVTRPPVSPIGGARPIGGLGGPPPTRLRRHARTELVNGAWGGHAESATVDVDMVLCVVRGPRCGWYRLHGRRRHRTPTNQPRRLVGYHQPPTQGHTH